MVDDYGDGVDADGIELLPPYVPLVDIDPRAGRRRPAQSDGIEQIPPYDPLVGTRWIHLARCNRCGSIVEGDVAGSKQHDVWHANLDRRIDQARTALPQRYAGSPLSRSAAEDFIRHDPGGAPSVVAPDGRL